MFFDKVIFYLLKAKITFGYPWCDYNFCTL